MAVDAYVHHHIPGRLRIRVPAAKGEEELLRELSSAIAKAPGISQVEYSQVTGSILIQYSPQEYRNLDSLDAGLSASAVPIVVKKVLPAEHPSHDRRHRRGRRSLAATKVDSFFSQLDNEIRSATDDELDLKFILPLVVGVLGIFSLRHSSTTPLWLTLLIFAFHSFLGLHTPAIDELYMPSPDTQLD
jgi:Heavy metal associated domain 2